MCSVNLLGFIYVMHMNAVFVITWYIMQVKKVQTSGRTPQLRHIFEVLRVDSLLFFISINLISICRNFKH